MNSSMCLHFPFKLNGYEYKTSIDTKLIRRENILTFSLPFNSLVSVNAEKGYTVYYKEAEESKTFSQIVTIEFKSINDAIAFYNSPSVHLSYKEPKNLENLNDKLAEVSDLLEKTGHSWRKKRKCSEPDEEGFITV